MNERPAFQGAPVFKGEILMCEDGEINQYVIKTHLSKLGFEVAVADDGKKGVDLVNSRMEKGEKPFGLILMDIFMPVMDGLEAFDTLTALGVKTPIVALTASGEPDDRKKYAERGFSDFLEKPVDTDALLACLNKYFTPVGYSQPAGNKRADEEKQRTKLLTSFVKKNQTTFADIGAAIEAGDIKLAHRLVHTLRGLAGLMGQTALKDAAHTVEYSLFNEKLENINDQMDVLGRELKPVLDELAPLLDGDKREDSSEKSFDKDKAFALFDRLKPLLLEDDAASLDLTDELKAFPGTGKLVEQIEEYEFEAALEILAGLIDSYKKP